MTERDFTRDDLDQMVAAMRDIEDYRDFVLRRFADYTHSTFDVRDDRDRKIEPVTRKDFPRTSGGYGQWKVPGNVGLSQRDIESGTVTVIHYMDDDRGPGSVSARVQMPLDFVFGEREKDERYAQYLTLKAEFEPKA